MKTTHLITMLIAGALFIQGCGKDQDLDDYKKARLQKNMADLQAVSGRYSGYLRSKKDNSLLGAMQVTLQASPQEQDSSDESKASAQPKLIANVEVQGASHIAIVANNSYYDSGNFQATIKIPAPQNSQTQDQYITLTGTISDGNLTGSLEAQGFSNFGGNFQLSNNGATLDALASQSQFDPNAIFTQKEFVGTTDFGNNLTKGVKMVLLKPETTSENDFLTLLSPVKPVQITFNYGDGARLTFSNGNWDQRTGVLTGQNVLTSGGQSVTLTLSSCHISADTQNIACGISTSSSSGIVANVNVIASTPQTPDPTDSSTTRDPVIHTYQGQAQLSPTDKWIPVTFTVVYPARTRMDEINDLFLPQAEETLQASFNFPGSKVGVSFPSTKWDSTKGTLDSSETISVGTQSNNLSMSCQNFNFDSSTTKYSFTCSYLSSLNNSYVQFKFSSQN